MLPTWSGCYCERVPSCGKDQAAPALGRAAPRLCKLRTRAAAVHAEFKTRVKTLRPLSSTSFLELSGKWCFQHRVGGMLARERHDLPRYVLFIAHLQSSSQGQRGCWQVTARPLSRRIEVSKYYPPVSEFNGFRFTATLTVNEPVLFAV